MSCSNFAWTGVDNCDLSNIQRSQENNKESFVACPAAAMSVTHFTDDATANYATAQVNGRSLNGETVTINCQGNRVQFYCICSAKQLYYSAVRAILRSRI